MSPQAERVVAAARSWIGTPYRHQASLKGIGCDCLGLVRGVWRETVGPEPEAPPPYAEDWAEAASAETLAQAAERWLLPGAPDDLRPGDVLLFRFSAGLPAKHAGILATPASFVHAYAAAAVVESPCGAWWRRRLARVFRFPEVS
jgi:NlpC/P60 family putative phage cell wall peptidase